MLKLGTMILLAMLATGCGSMRIASTLKPSGETGLALGKARFCLIDYTGEYGKDNPAAKAWTDMITRDFLAQRANTLYPEIFTDEWTALPVMVKAQGTFHDGLMIPSILCALTAGVVPFPGKMSMNLTVSSDVKGALGESLITKGREFEVEQVMWASLVGPLGCIPVPGQADLEKDSILLFIPLTKDAYSMTKLPTYITDCIVESVVRDLREVDPGLIDAAFKARASRLQEIAVDGRTFWVFLAPSISKETGKPIAFWAIFYGEQPKRGMTPSEQVVVARRDGSGTWVPETGYLRRTKGLTAVSVMMDKGVPAKVAVRTVAEPPLEDFIDLPDISGKDWAENLRWSNGLLLEAKNRSLMKMLKEKTGDELLTLVTRIEKAVLDLSALAERAKDNAQAIVEKGQGDPAPDRELSILCRQRIEILKPVLAAVKQAAGTKKQ
jgi:hypothetical protein